ncbi:MAG: SPOR domain-containing protein, partial [Xanthomonadaceae bacterium]|nr:SPOR domain-containing protein [Xanthomonadaceae bacterium]
MFLRLLFVLLVMLNIVAGAWLFLGQPYTHVPPATDPGVPELRLLSELPAQAATAAPAVVAPAPTAPTAATADASAAPRCLTIGPFDTPHDLQQARNALAPVATRMRSRQ